MSDNQRMWRLNIKGVVQSVGFRPFIKNLGDKHHLSGYVLNKGNEGVEIAVMANKKQVDEFIEDIKNNKPELAEIYHIALSKSDGTDNVQINEGKMEIRQSKSSSDAKSGIIPLPPDIAICRNCRNDLVNDPRRLNYSFTSCTDCGPRFSTIQDLPYDRPNTTFSDFPLCDDCQIEYSTSTNRRYHAQTTCCVNCGPQYKLYRSVNNEINEIEFDWDDVTDGLQAGQIIAVKGIGGSHFIVDAMNKDAVMRLRRRRRKQSNKPFAVMMPNINTINKYCKLTPKDQELLLSKKKPILILPTNQINSWTEVSPNLNNLGVMLPYSGFHYSLFTNAAPEVLVMTSANLPNLPMPIDNETIIKETKGIADLILVHNRDIVQRVDDSVIRSHGSNHLLIRRSRGYVPTPLFHNDLTDLPDLISLGAEESNTAALHRNGWIIPTQHIGHIVTNETLEFQKQSLSHFIDFYNLRPEIILNDLHPNFLTNLNRNYFTDKYNLEQHQVQHHLAHVASLALDNQSPLDTPFLAWSVDGYGYGTNKQSWGCELILLDNTGWQRLSSMVPMDYSGGDVNAKYPARMTSFYLKNIEEKPIDFFDKREEQLFKHGRKELDFINKIKLSQENTTTSMGRLLDAISVLLGLVEKRTYRGEPAIVLEQHALLGNEIGEINTYTTQHMEKEVVDNLSIFKQAFDWYREGVKPEDIAYMVHQTIGKSLADIGCNYADELNIDHLGFTGGVAYNQLITSRIRDEVTQRGKKFIQHKNIPPGDAGISSGQIYYIGRKLK